MSLLTIPNKNVDTSNANQSVHPRDYESLETIDATMFTGDPGETEDKFNLLVWYVERWHRRLKEVSKDPWFKNK
jgi:hypothetical protein